MNQILSCDYSPDNYFIDWLLDVIKLKLSVAIKPYKLIKLQQHITKDNVFNLTVQQVTNLNLYREMIRIVRSLKWRKVKDYYVIYVPSSMFVTNTDIPLSKLSRFVSYGDLTVRGYPILTDTIQGVIANIAKYVNEYDNLFYGGI